MYRGLSSDKEGYCYQRRNRRRDNIGTVRNEHVIHINLITLANQSTSEHKYLTYEII
jgi:hypothetical protein